MEVPNMANLEDFYGRHITEAEFQRMQNSQLHGGLMSMSGVGELSTVGMVGGDTLDDIVLQNQKEMQRRQSMQQPFPRQLVRQDGDSRSPSMLEFGSGAPTTMNGFDFDAASMAEGNGIGHTQRTPTSAAAESMAARRHPSENLALDTRFTNLGSGFPQIPHSSAFQSPQIHSAGALDLNGSGPYTSATLSAGLVNPMSIEFQAAGGDTMTSGEVTPMNQFVSNNLHQSLADPQFSPMPDFANDLRTSEDFGARTNSRGNSNDNLRERDILIKMPGLQMSDQLQTPIDDVGRADHPPQDQAMSGVPREEKSGQYTSSIAPPTDEVGPQPGQVAGRALGSSDDISPKPQPQPQPESSKMFNGIYSASGFDMLSVLMRVATRPNPEINIGAVDMSCAFVVCDCTQHDLPIIYCSDVFERLTGYTKHEILGRNCRFLQAPDGKVQSGLKRKYVDDDVVLHLKKKISDRREAQTSLINYRKGGQPFMNLLTIIPIVGSTGECQYFVGFQVDLVETPQSVTNKNPDGSYAINYQRGYLPRYIWQGPDNRNQAELGQTIPRDDVSTVLSTIGTGESELSKRIWDKVLLENTDDVVHVLSLKGLFLYLSPSSRRVLEYDSSELVGTALSSVCHPSDIVPVTRELKDTSTGMSVNVVFRIRRKQSGYTWFESHGSLHTEQGKGRKCIILVGRERPVYALSRSDINAAGGIGESELWTKMSTSGMFLYVSSNVKTLLDRQPDDLVGTSIQSLMRPDSKREFGRVLEMARTGKRTEFKHEMQNKRGQTLQAHTTLYPGDASEGQKPTFLVAQTRLLKISRSTVGPNSSKLGTVQPKIEQPSPGSASSPNGVSPPQQTTSIMAIVESATTTPGGSGLPIGTQDIALASEENVFDELKTTRSTSWQFELRQMEKRNRLLAEELQSLLSARKKRKRRKGAGQMQKDCANCHTRVTPEWRRGPSGKRDLCNSCGLRYAKQNGRVSPRTNSQHSDKQSASPIHSSPLAGEPLANFPPPSSMPPPERIIMDESGVPGTQADIGVFTNYNGGTNISIPAHLVQDVGPT